MNTEQINSIIRTFIKVIAGLLAAKGLQNEATLLNQPDVTAAVLLLFSCVWSHFSHSSPPSINGGSPPSGGGASLPLFLLAGFLFASSASAQTNLTQVPNLLPTNAPTFTLSGLLSGGWSQAGKDAVSFIEGTTNSGVIQIEAGALIGEKTHDVGGFVDVMLPVGGTNSLFGAGFGLAFYNNEFYDATLNARLGDTFQVPLLKIPVYAYLESGGGYNISRQEMMAQAFTGLTLPIPITANQTFTIGGAIGTISDLNENVLAIGCSYRLTF